MPTYFIDDAGDNSDGSTWAKAYSSVYAMLNHGTAPRGTSGVPFAAGDLVYIGNDTVDAASYTANTTIYGPASGVPVSLISSTVGSGTTVSYSASTTRQIDTSNNGANTYTLTVDGSWAIYGASTKSGAGISLSPDNNERIYCAETRLALAANAQLSLAGANTKGELRSCVIDLTADGSSTRNASVLADTGSGEWEVHGLTFVNSGYRTGQFNFSSRNSQLSHFSGIDFSGFQQAGFDIDTGQYNNTVYTNCLTHTTWNPVNSTAVRSDVVKLFTNCGPADAPTYLFYQDFYGIVASTPSIYRSGGATVEGDPVAWLITTTAVVSEGSPLLTPWIYGVVNNTGNRTFTLYITNDTVDFDNSQVWLEVEYLSTSDEAIWALGSDQRDNGTGAFISITEAVDTQTTESASTWVGLNDAAQGLADYRQILSVTATVNETGQFRARVAVGVASIAGSRYFYVDPKVTVT